MEETLATTQKLIETVVIALESLTRAGMENSSPPTGFAGMENSSPGTSSNANVYPDVNNITTSFWGKNSSSVRTEFDRYCDKMQKSGENPYVSGLARFKKTKYGTNKNERSQLVFGRKNEEDRQRPTTSIGSVGCNPLHKSLDSSVYQRQQNDVDNTSNQILRTYKNSNVFRENSSEVGFERKPFPKPYERYPNSRPQSSNVNNQFGFVSIMKSKRLPGSSTTNNINDSQTSGYRLAYGGGNFRFPKTNPQDEPNAVVMQSISNNGQSSITDLQFTAAQANSRSPSGLESNIFMAASNDGSSHGTLPQSGGIPNSIYNVGACQHSLSACRDCFTAWNEDVFTKSDFKYCSHIMTADDMRERVNTTNKGCRLHHTYAGQKRKSPLLIPIHNEPYVFMNNFGKASPQPSQAFPQSSQAPPPSSQGPSESSQAPQCSTYKTPGTNKEYSFSECNGEPFEQYSVNSVSFGEEHDSLKMNAIGYERDIINKHLERDLTTDKIDWFLVPDVSPAKDGKRKHQLFIGAQQNTDETEQQDETTEASQPLKQSAKVRTTQEHQPCSTNTTQRDIPILTPFETMRMHIKYPIGRLDPSQLAQQFNTLYHTSSAFEEQNAEQRNEANNNTNYIPNSNSSVAHDCRTYMHNSFGNESRYDTRTLHRINGEHSLHKQRTDKVIEQDNEQIVIPNLNQNRDIPNKYQSYPSNAERNEERNKQQGHDNVVNSYGNGIFTCTHNSNIHGGQYHSPVLDAVNVQQQKPNNSYSFAHYSLVQHVGNFPDCSSTLFMQHDNSTTSHSAPVAGHQPHTSQLSVNMQQNCANVKPTDHEHHLRTQKSSANLVSNCDGLQTQQQYFYRPDSANTQNNLSWNNLSVHENNPIIQQVAPNASNQNFNIKVSSEQQSRPILPNNNASKKTPEPEGQQQSHNQNQNTNTDESDDGVIASVCIDAESEPLKDNAIGHERSLIVQEFAKATHTCCKNWVLLPRQISKEDCVPEHQLLLLGAKSNIKKETSSKPKPNSSKRCHNLTEAVRKLLKNIDVSAKRDLGRPVDCASIVDNYIRMRFNEAKEDAELNEKNKTSCSTTSSLSNVPISDNTQSQNLHNNCNSTYDSQSSTYINRNVNSPTYPRQVASLENISATQNVPKVNTTRSMVTLGLRENIEAVNNSPHSVVLNQNNFQFGSGVNPNFNNKSMHNQMQSHISPESNHKQQFPNSNFNQLNNFNMNPNEPLDALNHNSDRRFPLQHLNMNNGFDSNQTMSPQSSNQSSHNGFNPNSMPLPLSSNQHCHNGFNSNQTVLPQSSNNSLHNGYNTNQTVSPQSSYHSVQNDFNTNQNVLNHQPFHNNCNQNQNILSQRSLRSLNINQNTFPQSSNTCLYNSSNNNQNILPQSSNHSLHNYFNANQATLPQPSNPSSYNCFNQNQNQNVPPLPPNQSSQNSLNGNQNLLSHPSNHSLNNVFNHNQNTVFQQSLHSDFNPHQNISQQSSNHSLHNGCNQNQTVLPHHNLQNRFNSHQNVLQQPSNCSLHEGLNVNQNVVAQSSQSVHNGFDIRQNVLPQLSNHSLHNGVDLNQNVLPQPSNQTSHNGFNLNQNMLSQASNLPLHNNLNAHQNVVPQLSSQTLHNGINTSQNVVPQLSSQSLNNGFNTNQSIAPQLSSQSLNNNFNISQNVVTQLSNHSLLNGFNTSQNIGPQLSSQSLNNGFNTSQNIAPQLSSQSLNNGFSTRQNTAPHLSSQSLNNDFNNSQNVVTQLSNHSLRNVFNTSQNIVPQVSSQTLHNGINTSQNIIPQLSSQSLNNGSNTRQNDVLQLSSQSLNNGFNTRQNDVLQLSSQSLNNGLNRSQNVVPQLSNHSLNNGFNLSQNDVLQLSSDSINNSFNSSQNTGPQLSSQSVNNGFNTSQNIVPQLSHHSLNSGFNLSQNNELQLSSQSLNNGFNPSQNIVPQLTNHSLNNGFNLSQNDVLQLSSQSLNSGFNSGQNIGPQLSSQSVSNSFNTSQNVDPQLSNHSLHIGSNPSQNVIQQFSNQSLDNGLNTSQNVISQLSNQSIDNGSNSSQNVVPQLSNQSLNNGFNPSQNDALQLSSQTLHNGFSPSQTIVPQLLNQPLHSGFHRNQNVTPQSLNQALCRNFNPIQRVLPQSSNDCLSSNNVELDPNINRNNSQLNCGTSSFGSQSLLSTVNWAEGKNTHVEGNNMTDCFQSSHPELSSELPVIRSTTAGNNLNFGSRPESNIMDTSSQQLYPQPSAGAGLSPSNGTNIAFERHFESNSMIENLPLSYHASLTELGGVGPTIVGNNFVFTAGVTDIIANDFQNVRSQTSTARGVITRAAMGNNIIFSGNVEYNISSNLENSHTVSSNICGIIAPLNAINPGARGNNLFNTFHNLHSVSSENVENSIMYSNEDNNRTNAFQDFQSAVSTSCEASTSANVGNGLGFSSEDINLGNILQHQHPVSSTAHSLLTSGNVGNSIAFAAGDNNLANALQHLNPISSATRGIINAVNTENSILFDTGNNIMVNTLQHLRHAVMTSMNTENDSSLNATSGIVFGAGDNNIGNNLQNLHSTSTTARGVITSATTVMFGAKDNNKTTNSEQSSLILSTDHAVITSESAENSVICAPEDNGMADTLQNLHASSSTIHTDSVNAGDCNMSGVCDETKQTPQE